MQKQANQYIRVNFYKFYFDLHFFNQLRDIQRRAAFKAHYICESMFVKKMLVVTLEGCF